MSLKTIFNKKQRKKEEKGKELTLPVSVSYPGSSHLNWNEIPLGVGVNGEITWKVTKSPHALIGGATGGGKSTVQRNIMLHCLQHSNDWDVLAVDLKKVEFSPYSKYKNVTIVNTLEDAVDELKRAVEVMVSRYKEMGDSVVNYFVYLPNKHKALMIIIDEISEILTSNELEKELAEEAKKSLLKISQLGRAVGVHLSIATQRPDHNIVSGELKGNIGLRYVTGSIPNSTASEILGVNATEEIPAIRGRGIVSIHGEKFSIQSYHADVNWFEEYKKENRD